MGFWISFFVSLALTVVGELLRPKQKFNDPKPSALGDFSFPTADATRVIQVWWGTCKLQGPNTTWFGDLEVVAMKKKVKTGWFSSTQITQGFKYYLGVELIFGYGPMDELIDFRLDDKSVFHGASNPTELGGYDGNVAGWLANMSNGQTKSYGPYMSITNWTDWYGFLMDSPALLGNDDPKNGVYGPVKIYKGTFNQPVNAYLQEQWGEVEASAMRPLIRVVMEHCYLGNSDTPPPVTLIGRRTPNPLGLTLGRHNIKGDANAANMCYEVMTNLIFGMKIPATKIDVASFVDAGNTLAAEGLGLSMTIETAMKGKDLLAEILRHVDGVIYPDPQTGLYVFKLARDDYDVNDLMVFDKTNIAPGSFEFSRMSWEDTKNTTIVNYVNRYADFNPEPVPYQDLANVFVRRGQIDSEQIDFLGFSNADAALKAAARANKTRSSPLCRVAFETDRTGYALRPGSVIKIVMPDKGIVSLIGRVVELNYGTLDDPAVKVVCTEDIFTVNALAFDPPDQGSGWVPPGGDPQTLLAQRLEEAPHFGAGDDRPYVMTLATRAGALDLGYEVWSDPTGGTAYALTNTTNDFTPSALLTAAYGKNGPDVDETGFTVSSAVDMSFVDQGETADRDDGRNLAVINGEWMAWRNMVNNGDGTYTFQGVYRAVLDTVAQDHLAGDRVWFPSEGAGLTTPDGYGQNVTVHAKLLPTNSRGTLPLASAADVALTTASRSLRPLVPGKVRVNGVRPADLVGTVTGAFTAAWAHRSRLDDQVRTQSANSVTPEEGTTYNLRFRNAATNALLIERTGADATTANVALAYTGNVKMELEAVRDGLTSRAVQSHVFAYDAGGTTVSAINVDETDYVLDGGGA